MHKLMTTSSVYRQSSRFRISDCGLRIENHATAAALGLASSLFSNPKSEIANPKWEMPLLRLDAEALYDTMLFSAGKLDETPFGPGDQVQVRPDGLITPNGSDKGWRRLIYVRQTRKQIPTLLENFDFPQMNPNCLERRDSTVAPQALHLLNNGMVQQLAEHFAQRVKREAGNEPTKQIERVYLIALTRTPTEAEKKLGVEALARLSEKWEQHLTKIGKPDKGAAGLKALTSYCHAILNSAGFLYVD